MEQTTAIIRKSGDKWEVLSEDGKKHLGTYNSKQEAETRLRQIEYFKSHPKATVLGSLVVKPLPGSKKNDLPAPDKVFASGIDFDAIIKSNIVGNGGVA